MNDLVIEKIKRSQRLAELQTQSGWVDLGYIIDEIKADALRKIGNLSIPDAEVMKSRMRLILADEILGKVDLEIEMGRMEMKNQKNKGL